MKITFEDFKADFLKQAEEHEKVEMSLKDGVEPTLYSFLKEYSLRIPRNQKHAFGTFQWQENIKLVAIGRPVAEIKELFRFY